MMRTHQEEGDTGPHALPGSRTGIHLLSFVLYKTKSKQEQNQKNYSLNFHLIFLDHVS